MPALTRLGAPGGRNEGKSKLRSTRSCDPDCRCNFTRIAAVGSFIGTYVLVDDLEFGPLGETTRSSPTTIWLAAGSGPHTRYLPVTVDPVTGLAEVGDFTAKGPPEALMQPQAAEAL